MGNLVSFPIIIMPKRQNRQSSDTFNLEDWNPDIFSKRQLAQGVGNQSNNKKKEVSNATRYTMGVMMNPEEISNMMNDMNGETDTEFHTA